MSEATEEAMDGSAASEEQLSPDKPTLWGVGEIIEGKRAKKSVERLDMQVPKKTVKLSIGDGNGEKLGDIPRTCHQLNKMKPVDLVPLHSLLFDRRGKLSLIKKNLRQFNGFPFDADSEQFNKKRDKLQKNFTNTKLKLVCEVLDLEKKGTHSDLVDRIMTFLVSPKSSGKRLPKKKKRSKKKLSGDDSKPKKTSKKRNSSKQKPSSNTSPKKSKAIVMDSSSDEEEDEEERKTATETDGSDAGSGAESGDKHEEDERSEDEEEEDEDEESPKPKARGKDKKVTPSKKTKSQKKPANKRSRKEETDSESESSDSQPQKKKSKPATKTKKADSSSYSKTNNTTADDSSDEDEPLSKMVKKTPSDQQLKETVQSLLKEADLEELTMKQICQKVFEAYSEHDLSSKKDFIKQTVKSLIT
ncbi:protein DEK [Boleophthalmus pectinirostris]|uniref:protein DEK n=1 Tax=Boleophthalmus pectinirostris TaxID=150288 RepID=UPI002430EACC|nr:protein DEK [Boleophthalmus pectinirostris]